MARPPEVGWSTCCGARWPESELLYLGGNADLYVLVDPCDDDEVLYVSVGATRLIVTDEVTC